MKLHTFFIALFLFFSTAVVAQKVIKHKVKSGESIYALAKKYDVTEKEIYDMNPKLKGAILGLKTEVKIPNKKYKPEEKKPKPVKKEEVVVTNEPTTVHLVVPKETLYSISKKYGISMEAICEMNPELKTGNLKSGMKLKLTNVNQVVPIKMEASNPVIEQVQQKKEELTKVVVDEPKSEATANSSDVIHKVLPKETLFKISKKYNISISELQKLNPSVVSGLPVGFDLVIKKGTTEKSIEAPKAITPIQTVVDDVKPLSSENMSKAEFLIAKASENLGTRYRSGGTTSEGFDCSGLMFTTFKNIDMTLPRSSYDMAKYGQKIDRTQAQKGDLIFFATFGRGRVSHVGMVTEVLDDEIKFIHSSTQSGVIISSTKEDYYARSFVQVNRVLLE
ncbi:MAG: LysM peptidoglycan-binding domain-containing protein [Bacteroidota bacterium]